MIQVNVCMNPIVQECTIMDWCDVLVDWYWMRE